MGGVGRGVGPIIRVQLNDVEATVESDGSDGFGGAGIIGTSREQRTPVHGDGCRVTEPVVLILIVRG